MQFNSLDFLLFAGVFFGLWPLLRRWNNSRWVYLTAASFLFYGWWDWRFLFLIVGSGLIDFFAGLGMARFTRHRKVLLVASIIGNIGSLAAFKYLDFLVVNLNWLRGAFGDQPLDLPGLILPVGISFYTFQSMSYTIDVYRRKMEPTSNVFHFFAYLSMFPQLVAGPIVRAADLLPQLRENRPVSEYQRWTGTKLIVLGFFKKVVVADTIAPVVAAAFSRSQPEASACYWWVVMAMFAYQIYCDFSGYSDIARGLGRWMGYEFPVNFDHPYIAVGFRDFWSRWHISLSTWFRDYVYIPLGGSRRSAGRSQVNLWITMVLSGLWHGAQWTFVIWGAMHSALLSVERLTGWPKRIASLPGGRHLGLLITFLLTLVTWVFFRAESFAQAGTVLTMMFDITRLNASAAGELLDSDAGKWMGVMMLRQLYFHFGLNKRTSVRLAGRRARRWAPAMLAVMILLCIYLRGTGTAFIYFQF